MIASDAVKQHAHDMQCKWQAYVVSDSNFMWFIDDYMKLQSYNIDIYADIDAYSCYIIWIYVEIMIHTAVSMLTQFLDIIQNVQLQFWIVWSDKNNEKVFLKQAHHIFLKAYDSDISLKNCYFYDTDVKN